MSNNDDLLFVMSLGVVALITVRALGVLDIPWLWVFAPLWIPYLAYVIVMIVCYVTVSDEDFSLVFKELEDEEGEDRI